MHASRPPRFSLHWQVDSSPSLDLPLLNIRTLVCSPCLIPRSQSMSNVRATSASVVGCLDASRPPRFSMHWRVDSSPSLDLPLLNIRTLVCSPCLISRSQSMSNVRATSASVVGCLDASRPPRFSVHWRVDSSPSLDLPVLNIQTCPAQRPTGLLSLPIFQKSKHVECQALIESIESNKSRVLGCRSALC